MITVEATDIVLRVDSTGSIKPDKTRAIEFALHHLRNFGLDDGHWCETGAHQDGEHIWIVGLRRELSD